MKLAFRNPFSSPLRLRRRVRHLLRRLTWKKLLKWSLWAAGAGVVVVALLFAWYARDLPTPGKIKRTRSVEATQIFDRNGTPLYAVFGEEKRLSIPADQIPEVVKQATIAVEDKDFYKHYGINLRSVLRAILNNLKRTFRFGRASSLQGGSTITQQYVKNALLSPERTLDRKIKEVILALELEALYSKDEILALYLNEIPYGSNAYGIEAAAQTFFGKSAKELTLAEAASLAALPQRPTYLSPYGSHTDELESRQNYILKRMATLGFIAEAAVEEAAAAKITFVPRREQILAPHFVFFVRDRLVEKYGEQMVLEGGLKVTTTLDVETQRIAEAAVVTAAEKYLAKYNADNAALAAVDPKTGQVLAMVGSVDYFDTEHEGNFNVTTAARQPGSAFKPIVYATAFKRTWHPASTLWDLTTDFGNYTPQNYDGTVRGPVTIRQALANSLNIPAVKMLALAGIDEVLETAQATGITTLNDPSRYGLSLVLGGAEVKPLELAAAYGMLAAGGVYHPTGAILRVEDSKGRLLEEWRDEPKVVLAPEIAYQITHILSDNEARTPVFGGRSSLYFPGLNVAGKTGTTQEYRDGWTVGYSPSVAAAIWVGNNDNSPMDKAGGVRAAGPIFHDFMTAWYRQREPDDFARTDTLQEVTLDRLSGQLPSEHSPETITDILAPWQIPTERDDVHIAVLVNRITGKLATELTPPDLIEERLYTQLHSEQPSNPAWENPVLAWAQEHGLNISAPPSERDDASPDSWPKITLSSPTTNQAVSGNFEISAAVTAANGVRKVDFAIDNVVVATRTEPPWTLNYDAKNLVTGHHEVTVTVTDGLGATQSASDMFIVVTDQTPPAGVSAAAASALGAGSIRLAWQNPTDADLVKVRIYRSTSSGVIGNLVTETDAAPGTDGAATLAGHTPGSSYYFTLRPVDAAGNENTSTSQVKATAL